MIFIYLEGYENSQSVRTFFERVRNRIKCYVPRQISLIGLIR